MLEELFHAAIFPVLRGTVGKDRVLKAAWVHVAQLTEVVLCTVEEHWGARSIKARLLRRRIGLAIPSRHIDVAMAAWNQTVDVRS